MAAAHLTDAELVTLPAPDVAARLAHHREQLAGQFAAGTVNRRLAAVRGFLRWLVAQGRAPWRPAPRVPNVRSGQPSRPYVTRQAVAAALERLDAKGWGLERDRDVALVRLFWDMGLRLSEVLSVEGRHVQLFDARPSIFVRQKAGARQQVLLPGPTVPALRRLPMRDDEPVFPLTPRTVQRRIKRLGLISPHAIRRGAATSAHNAGVSLRSIQDYLRHSDLKTTANYVRHDRHAAALQVSRAIAIGREERHDEQSE